MNRYINLLDYLVPSPARRGLLRTLQAHERGLTVRQLSLRAGVTYSNAHREVDLMKRAGLLHTERVGNAVLCSWKGKSSEARILAPLLDTRKTSSASPPDEEAFFWNLKRWSAPLSRTGTPGKRLTLEETLAQALALARRDADVARVWPVLLAKNRSEVDIEELEFLARRLGEKKALGFFLSLTGRLLKDPSLARHADRLHDGRVRRMEDFFRARRGKRARALAGERTPDLAREWCFRMNMSLESFEQLFRKFVRKP